MTEMTHVNRRILVVDDNRDIHDDFRKLLGKEASSDLDAMAAMLFDLPAPRSDLPSFELSFAAQGAEGFEMVVSAVSAGRPYALVFMDMRMPPGWDGLETLEHIWVVDPLVQAVICTAHSDYSWEQITDRLGPTDRLLVLKKPFDPLEVRQLALAMTEKWNDRNERARSEAEMRGLLRALPDALCLVGESGVVLRSQVPLGFPRSLPLEADRPFAEALPASARQPADERLRRVLESGAGERLVIEAGADRFEVRWERVDSTQSVVVVRALAETARPPAAALHALRDESAPASGARVPIVPVGPAVMVVPLVGLHDAAKMQSIAGALAAAVRARGARAVVLDISCVTAGPDTIAGIAVAAQAIRAAGAHVVLTGLPPIEPDGDGSVPPCYLAIEDGIAHALALAASSDT